MTSPKSLLSFASVAALVLVAACSGSPVTVTKSQFKRADMNKDNAINIAEYHALIDIQARDGYPLAKDLLKQNPHEMERTLQDRFDYLDTNNDNKLSREELAVSKD